MNACATIDGLKMLKPIFDKAKSLHSHILFHRGAAAPGIPGQPTLYAPTESAGGVPWARSTLNTYYQLTAADLGLQITTFNIADLTYQERRQIMVENGVELLAEKGVIA